MLHFPDSNSRRRILLLGPKGQLGWELHRSLQNLGKVVSVGREPSLVESHPLTVDLADPDSIRKVIREVQPAVIVNAAGYTAVDKAEEEFEKAQAINGAAVGVIAEEANQIGSGLVHYSTDYVFDGSGEEPWTEEDRPAPVNAYGQSKLLGEEAIRAAGVGHVILRVSWVFGVHGANFVKTMLRLAREREDLSVVNDQIGAPTSARVIADATACILAQLPAEPAEELKQTGGTFHLVCGGETNWYEYAREIFRLARLHSAVLAVRNVEPIRTEDYPVPAKRPLNSRMSCRRVAERFGLTPPPWHVALWHVIEQLTLTGPVMKLDIGE